MVRRTSEDGHGGADALEAGVLRPVIANQGHEVGVEGVCPLEPFPESCQAAVRRQLVEDVVNPRLGGLAGPAGSQRRGEGARVERLEEPPADDEAEVLDVGDGCGNAVALNPSGDVVAETPRRARCSPARQGQSGSSLPQRPPG